MSLLVGFLCLLDRRGWSCVLLCCCCDLLVVSSCSGAGQVNSGWSRRGTRLFINLRFLVRICLAAALMTYLRCGLTPITTPYMSHILVRGSYRAICDSTWISDKGCAVLLQYLMAVCWIFSALSAATSLLGCHCRSKDFGWAGIVFVMGGQTASGLEIIHLAMKGYCDIVTMLYKVCLHFHSTCRVSSLT